MKEFQIIFLKKYVPAITNIVIQGLHKKEHAKEVNMEPQVQAFEINEKKNEIFFMSALQEALE